MTEQHADATLRQFATRVSLAAAVVTTVVKLAAWLLTGSVSLLTAAVDSLIDTGASLVTFAGVRYAERPADREHRFGHGKGEAVAAFTQATFLAGAAIVLAFQSAERLIFPEALHDFRVGVVVTAGSLAVTAGLVLMQTAVLRRTRSTAIAADRVHYRTDLAINVAVLAALLVTHVTGWRRADPVFALTIAGWMILTARSIAVSALVQLLDREIPRRDRERIRTAVLAVDGVRDVHDLRTRFSGDRTFVEYHLEVDGGLSVEHGHAIGDTTEAAVGEALGGKVEATAHLEPEGIEDERLDARVTRVPAP